MSKQPMVGDHVFFHALYANVSSSRVSIVRGNVSCGPPTTWDGNCYHSRSPSPRRGNGSLFRQLFPTRGSYRTRGRRTTWSPSMNVVMKRYASYRSGDRGSQVSRTPISHFRVAKPKVRSRHRKWGHRKVHICVDSRGRYLQRGSYRYNGRPSSLFQGGLSKYFRRGVCHSDRGRRVYRPHHVRWSIYEYVRRAYSPRGCDECRVKGSQVVNVKGPPYHVASN